MIYPLHKIDSICELKKMLDDCFTPSSLETIFKKNKQNEFFELLKNEYKEPTWYTTQNFLWYEKDYIFKCLGIED